MINKEAVKIVVAEDHDRAYYAWREAGVKNKVLVHIDAHIDFGWIPDLDMAEIDSADLKPGVLLNPFIKSRKQMINIGNYIYPAMRDGLVDKFYWIVPDASWYNRNSFKHIKADIVDLLKLKQGRFADLEIKKEFIRFKVIGKEVLVTTLKNLEVINAPVLLDIDVDFLTTSDVCRDRTPDRLPWISSQELKDRISGRVKDIEMLTIVYSVEGGFTPLRFKYLGDELRSLFEGNNDKKIEDLMVLKKQAVGCLKEKKYRQAADIYEKALGLNPDEASSHFNLFELYSRRLGSDIDKARYHYQQAIACDKAYATSYNNCGIILHQSGKIKAAEEEYELILKVDPARVEALSGLGYIVLRRNEFKVSQKLFDKALAINPNYFPAFLGKGLAVLRSHDLKSAEVLFEQAGQKYPDEPEVRWWLARVYEKKGLIEKAIAAYKQAVLLGGEGPLVHLILAGLYLKKGLWLRFIEESERFFKQFANNHLRFLSWLI